MKNIGAILAILATSASFVVARAVPQENSIAERQPLAYVNLAEIEAREPKKNKAAKNATASAVTAATNSTTATGNATKKGKAGKVMPCCHL
jgi:hypothetical protein